MRKLLKGACILTLGCLVLLCIKDYKETHRPLVEVKLEGLKTKRSIYKEALDKVERYKQEELKKQKEEEARKALEPQYNPNDLRVLSNLTPEQLDTMLEGSYLKKLSPHILEYEKEYNVNALFVLSLVTEESGHGTSYLARTHKNIAGMKNSRGGYRTFPNWTSCAKEVFRLIDEEYLSEGGKFKVKDSNIKSVNLRYCPNPKDPYSWSENINTIAQIYLERID